MLGPAKPWFMKAASNDAGEVLEWLVYLGEIAVAGMAVAVAWCEFKKAKVELEGTKYETEKKLADLDAPGGGDA